MSDADDEKVLEQITALLHGRVQNLLFRQVDRGRLKGALREMKIVDCPIRVVDVTADGHLVQAKLELTFRFDLSVALECPDCKGRCHSGSPDVGHRCRCPNNCA